MKHCLFIQLIVVPFLFLPSIANAQIVNGKVINELTRNKLNAKPKMVSESTYDAIPSEGTVKKGAFNYMNVRLYDSNGFVTEITGYRSPYQSDRYKSDTHLSLIENRDMAKKFKIASGVVVDYHYTFQYDSIGRLIAETLVHNESRNNRNTVYIYDSNNNLIEKRLTNQYGLFDGKTLYKYNQKGYNIEQTIYESDSSLDEKVVLKYNAKGFLIGKYEYLFGNGWKGQLAKTTYKNDEVGRMIEENSYLPDKKINMAYKYGYDSCGNMIMEQIYQPNCGCGNNFDVINFRYDFDKNHNWVMKYETKVYNFFHTVLVERIIEYY